MQKKALLDSNEHNSYYVHEDEKQQLLDGEKKAEVEKKVKPWQRWRTNQVIPELVIITDSFFTYTGLKSIGISLLDLQIRTGASIEQMSWYLSAGAVGGMLGALVLGQFIEQRSRWLQLSAATCLSGVVFCIVAWFYNFWLQLTFFLLLGAVTNYLTTGGMLTAYCLFDNPKDSIMWQNINQMSMSVGALMAPLITHQFLLEIQHMENSTLLTNMENSTLPSMMNSFTLPSFLETSASTNSSKSSLWTNLPRSVNGAEHSINVEISTQVITNVTFPTPSDVRVMYAFMVPGCALVVVSIVSVVVHFAFGGVAIQTVKGGDQKNIGENNENAANCNNEATNQKSAKNVKVIIIILLIFFYIVFSLFLRTFSNYIVPFTVNQLGWTKTQGSNLAATYFAMSMFSKVFLIIAVRHFPIEYILNLGFTICTISCMALSFLLDYHASIIWIFSNTLSIGTTTVVGLLMAWTAKNIGLEGYVGIIYSLAQCAGEIIFNPIIGYLIGNVSYMSLIYLVFTGTVVCQVLMIVLQILGEKYRKLSTD